LCARSICRPAACGTDRTAANAAAGHGGSIPYRGTNSAAKGVLDPVARHEDLVSGDSPPYLNARV
jgi:hypothetical protein